MANSDLEFIIDNIGENKVNLNINTNEFIETAATAEHKINKYTMLPNLIENYKSTPKSVSLSDTDKILIACIKHIDESLTLVSFSTLQSKLEVFKKELDICRGTKKLCDFKIAAMFIKINIATKENLYECGDLTVQDTLYITDENTYKILPKETCKKHIAMHRLSQKENLNINTLLVKELRELANELYIPTVSPEDKKPYLKKELKEIIFDYINEYTKSHI